MAVVRRCLGDVVGTQRWCLHGSKVHGNGNGTTPLTLVSSSGVHAQMRVAGVVLEHSHEWSSEVLVGLRSRTLDERRRHRGRHRKVGVGHAVLEGFQGDQFGKLNAEHLGMTSKMMNQNLTGLLLFGKITALVETSRVGRIHVEQRRTVQFHHETTRPGRSTVGLRAFTRFQSDILDVREGVFNLVSGGVIVDVISHAGLLRRVKDDQVHSILSDASPAANGQRTAGEMVDHWECVSNVQKKKKHKCMCQFKTLDLPTLPEGVASFG